MARWRDVFNDEKCKCGKKGTRIISVNGKVVGFSCEEHYSEEKKGGNNNERR